ncbi:hypothetical protein SacmaDRAFT_3972 [Saccharomonospora marina XMU15]|uniref:Uncharacterized protein n=1 Tax=Saccharomonospora marina XMU15 TaxID=882083 RepID=H5X3V1_9PSEU|nr:hypothetical protein [Saccharomonospora marina]EHR52169.1 hypothetical protein SacmaDRAFT_3972 [Saccharomonospora marina XMU15]
MEPVDLGRIVLSKGANPTRTYRLCLQEAVAWFADEPHSDRPRCVSPVLSQVGRVLGDRLPDGKRQRLKDFVPALVNTVDDRDDDRSRLAVDWLVRDYAPAWLRLVPQLELAAESLTRRRPVLTVPAAAEAVAGPREAVGNALYTLYGSAVWRGLRDQGTELLHAISRRLSRNAGECAVVGTTMLAQSFIPVCGKIRLMVEAALLLAACAHAARHPGLSTEQLAAAAVHRAEAEVEDGAIELYSRLIQVRERASTSWLDDDLDRLLGHRTEQDG